ncbi:MAG: zf-HC2 domain-containing protein [Acidobacteria bacterium]|nr:zf-HC2 domain-containing protein [Acidobacteriota bacterium]
MKCAELRAMAESYLAGELPVDTSHEIITHLDRCEECRTELDARIALRQTLRRAFLSSETLAPTGEFTERVRASLGTEAAAGRRWFGHVTPWIAIAASVAFVLTVSWQVLRSTHQPEASSALAALAAHAAGDHRHCALDHSLEELPISLDEAARRYNPAYATLREVVSQSGPVRGGTIEILGAHWCVFDGRSFAHVVVRHRGRVASILLTPIGQTPAALTSAAQCPSSEGFRVACFDARGHAGFVVSDLTDSENLDLARVVAPVLQSYFARG